MTSGGPRDWDKELADIDKIIAQTPPARLGAGSTPAPAGGAAAAPARVAPAAAPVSRRAALSTWLKVGLGVALAVGMTQWPYVHACGPALFLYAGAIGVVGVSGVWGMVSSWRQRMGAAHGVSLLVLLWSGLLAAATVLPRIGYARETATWFCP